MEISRLFEVAADYNNCVVILASIRIICGDRNGATIPQSVHKSQNTGGGGHGPIGKKNVFTLTEHNPTFGHIRVYARELKIRNTIHIYHFISKQSVQITILRTVTIHLMGKGGGAGPFS